MTNKELKKLSRADLLELLLEERRENERLRAVLKKACEKLADKNVSIQNAGSIADAALALNGVFEAAEAAAAQYLDNVKRLSESGNIISPHSQAEADADKIVADADADKIVADADADKIVADADAYSSKTRADADAYSRKVHAEADAYKAHTLKRLKDLLEDKDALRVLLSKGGNRQS